MKILNGIVMLIAGLGLVVIVGVCLALYVGVLAAGGYLIGDAWADAGVAGACAGALAGLAWLIVTCRQPIANLRHAIPAYIRHQVLQRDEFCCQQCGSTHELQIDHIRPVSLGGDNAITNLQVLCGPCNRRKSNRYIG
jgi:hypothetical protein